MPITFEIKPQGPAQLTGLSRIVADQHGASAWIEVYSKNYRGEETRDVNIFMDYRIAQSIEAAFIAYEDSLDVEAAE